MLIFFSTTWSNFVIVYFDKPRAQGNYEHMNFFLKLGTHEGKIRLLVDIVFMIQYA
jgi:hypothetical protein